MKRLGIISTQIMPWGGSEEIWADLALAARGQGVAVRASVSENSRCAPRVATLAGAGVEFSFRRESPCVLPGFPRRAVNFVRRKLGAPVPTVRPVLQWEQVFREHPDIVLICQGGAYCGVGLAGLAEWLWETRVPYVVLCQSARSQWPVNEPLRERVRAYYDRAARVGFVSAGNREEIRVQLADPIRNQALFQNPIAFSPHEPVPWTESDLPLLSCPARFNVADKGQDLLLQVLTSAAWRRREFRCVLFGAGPDDAYLRRLVQHLGLNEQVVFGGETQGTRPIWQQTHLMILPSRSEGLSLVLLEAMAAGRPSVVTGVGGHAEWLRDGQDGYVAAMPCLTALAEAMERAWEARPHWQAIGQSARRRFLTLYDPNPVGSLLKSLAELATRLPIQTVAQSDSRERSSGAELGAESVRDGR